MDLDAPASCRDPSVTRVNVLSPLSFYELLYIKANRGCPQSSNGWLEYGRAGTGTHRFAESVMKLIMETVYQEAYCLPCGQRDGFGRSPRAHEVSRRGLSTHDVAMGAGQAINTVAQFMAEIAREA